ncbi:MAG: hypothetical protein ACJA1C_002525 [Crocinitomicaceae bacterium]
MSETLKIPGLTILKYKETKNSVTILGDDKLIRQFSKKGSYDDLDTAIENIAIAKNFLENKKGVMMVDISGCLGTSLEARKYYSSSETGQHFYACAIVVNSAVSRVIGNFLIRINKVTIPVELFTSQEDAIQWLKSNFIQYV